MGIRTYETGGRECEGQKEERERGSERGEEEKENEGEEKEYEEGSWGRGEKQDLKGKLMDSFTVSLTFIFPGPSQQTAEKCV